ncbi:hypothetical protein [Microbacterium gubbeenense]|uniref:hypothetical protein n=1 Tax=Microbacterium gubbeenense TaxID=159896 RepID=UPI0004200E3A|nr:hypothetical protein [Microbacterium gubbeenense]
MNRDGIFEKWNLLEGNLVDMIGGVAVVLSLVAFFWIAGKKNFSVSAIIIGAVIGAAILVMAAAGGLSGIASVIVQTFQNL